MPFFNILNAVGPAGNALQPADAGTMQFYVEGQSPSTGFQVDTSGNIVTAGTLTYGGQFVGTGSNQPITISNSTTETVVSSLTIPVANQYQNAQFSGGITCNVSTAATGSPAITARVRIGGLTGTVITSVVMNATTSQTNIPFFVGWGAGVVTTGANGTWTGAIYDIDLLVGPNINLAVPTAAVTNTTLTSQALVLTLQWGAAISGNTLTTNMSNVDQVS